MAPAHTARDDASARNGGRDLKRPYGDGQNIVRVGRGALARRALASPFGGGVAARLTQAP